MHLNLLVSSYLQDAGIFDSHMIKSVDCQYTNLLQRQWDTEAGQAFSHHLIHLSLEVRVVHPQTTASPPRPARLFQTRTSLCMLEQVEVVPLI